VNERHEANGEGNSQVAAETRRLLIERLPLFLHDRVGKPTAFKFAWFRQPDNFLVSFLATARF
jgi:hypothetical protein